MNRCQTKNDSRVPAHFIDVARILAYAATRPETPSTPPITCEREVDIPTGYTTDSMV